MSIKHLHTAAAAVDFLIKMGELYRRDKPLSRDCRSTVVKWMLDHPRYHWTGSHIMIYGFKGSRDVVHVILVDDHDRVIADAYNPPKPASVADPARGEDRYLMHLPSGDEYLDLIDTIDVPSFLETYALHNYA